MKQPLRSPFLTRRALLVASTSALLGCRAGIAADTAAIAKRIQTIHARIGGRLGLHVFDTQIALYLSESRQPVEVLSAAHAETASIVVDELMQHE